MVRPPHQPVFLCPRGMTQAQQVASTSTVARGGTWPSKLMSRSLLYRVLALTLATLSGTGASQIEFNKPFQVVRPTQNHSSMIPVVKNLRLMAQHDANIALISVVGPYHSGKSFLLNSLAGNMNTFAIGSKTSPETMGIWLCRTDMKASDGSEVWLMDSEGFFGPDVSESYDAKIFTIAS